MTEQEQVDLLDGLIEKVRCLVSDYPDTAYTGECSYWEGGQNGGSPLCGCLIGQAVQALNDPRLIKPFRLFPTSSFLFVMDKSGITAPYASNPENVRRRLDWLSYVQSLQDNGTTWLECVQRTDKLYPLSEKEK